MHAFWNMSDPNTVFVERVLFLKNLSTLGAALLISQFGAGPLSIDERRSNRTNGLAVGKDHVV
jgi:putative oxidoreductase